MLLLTLLVVAALAAVPPEAKVREEVILPSQSFTLLPDRTGEENARREKLWMAASVAHPPATKESTPDRIVGMMWTLTMHTSLCPKQRVHVILVRVGWSNTSLFINSCANALDESELLNLMEKEPTGGQPVILNARR